MPVADLKAQIERSAEDLRNIWTSMQAASGLTLPRGIYEHWINKARLHNVLSATTGIFPHREKAWEAVTALNSKASIKDESRNLVTYGSLVTDFSVARHLVLTAYIAVTWSIYDRLSNVCGRLAAAAELAEDPKNNPKICEDFLERKKAILGYSANICLQQAYRWPLKVSYKIRNWLVHEGYEEGSIPLFKGDEITDGFTLHEQAAQNLQRLCQYKDRDDGGIEACCLSGAEECWPSRDIFEILGRYHTELDTMFTSMVKWSVASFIGQITAFAERDKTALASAAAK